MTMQCIRFLSPLFVLCVFVVNSPAADPTYWKDIRPVLRKHCTACHTAKNLKEIEVSGGLALHNYETVMRKEKPVVIVGKSADSSLIQSLLHKEEAKRMPKDAPALTEETIALLRRWIDSGAKEGTRPDDVPLTTAPPRVKKLDVLLPTDLVPPPNVLGPAKPAKLELALKAGPLAPVTAVTFSPDGKLLVTGSYGLVTIWDLNTGQPAKVLTNVLGAVNDLRFSPDGKVLAVAGGQPSAKGDLRLFNVADWKLIANLGGHADVVSCAIFSNDGKHLASASFDKTVRIWDAGSHKLLQSHSGHSDFVYAVAFNPDGTWIASASKDRTVKIVETLSGKSLLTLSGMDQEVLAVAVSADGKQVVCSGTDPGFIFFNAQTGARVRRQGGHGVSTNELALSKDGQLILSAGSDRLVRLSKFADSAVVKTFTIGSVAYAAAISQDGKLVASGSFDGLVRLWDVNSGKHLLTLMSLPVQEEKHDWLALTPAGYAGSSDGVATLGQWRMAGQDVPAEMVWKALRQPDAVAKAVKGEMVAAPVFK